MEESPSSGALAESSAGSVTSRVALAVVVTRPPSLDWVDALAVFAFAADRTLANLRADRLAIVPEGFPGESVRVLEELGFNVRPLPIPVPLAHIQNEYARDQIKRAGCCGDA